MTTRRAFFASLAALVVAPKVLSPPSASAAYVRDRFDASIFTTSIYGVNRFPLTYEECERILSKALEPVVDRRILPRPTPWRALPMKWRT